MEDIVIGIDSSTQSTKAIAWSKEGKNLGEGRCDIPLHNPKVGFFEQNTEDWWLSCKSALLELSKKIDPNRVAGVSISNQRETIGFFDKNMQPCHPAIVWLDRRCADQLEIVGHKLSSDFIHQTTGRPVDPILVLYRLSWLKNHKPTVYRDVMYFCDVQSFLVWKLTKNLHTGMPAADATGYFDLQQKEWSKEILKYLEINESQLPKVFLPGELLGEVTISASQETGLKVGTPIFAGSGDGQAAALGANCVSSDRAYINLGTAIVFGTWSSVYRTHRGWRTEIAAHDKGYIFESCLISGVFLINWFLNQFFPEEEHDKTFFEKIEKQIENIPIGSNGILTLPYWANCMDPHWDAKATGCFIGLRSSHKRLDLYRSILEGLILEQAQSLNYMENNGGVQIDRFTAVGGGASSSIWVKMLADCTGKKVDIMDTLESSSLGAGMIAAKGVGWFSSIAEASYGMRQNIIDTVIPNLSNQDTWKDLLSIYKKIYPHNLELFSDLNDFKNKYNKKNINDSK